MLWFTGSVCACMQSGSDTCDLLIQVAIRYDLSVHYTCHRLQDSRDHIVKILYKLILKGKLHAVVCLVPEYIDGSVLEDPDAMVTVGQDNSISVRDPFLLKHLKPQLCALSCCDILPRFKDVEVCSAYVQAVAYRIQGGVVMLLVGVMLYFTTVLIVNV